MDIFLVRHGEAAASWGKSSDPGLSELGSQQARQAAEELQSLLPLEVQLVSSPLLRAIETAQSLADLLSAPVTVNEAFREIPSPVPLPERQSWLRGFMAQTWAGQPQELLDWRDQAIQQVLEQTAPAVIFTHFLVINTLVGSIQGRAETLCFWPDNASITHLKKRGDTLELVSTGREVDTVVNL